MVATILPGFKGLKVIQQLVRIVLEKPVVHPVHQIKLKKCMKQRDSRIQIYWMYAQRSDIH